MAGGMQQTSLMAHRPWSAPQALCRSHWDVVLGGVTWRTLLGSGTIAQTLVFRPEFLGPSALWGARVELVLSERRPSRDAGRSCRGASSPSPLSRVPTSRERALSVSSRFEPG